MIANELLVRPRRMPALTIRLWRPWLSLVGVVILTVMLHLIWLYRFRFGYITEWDESGYISIALNNTNALHSGGPAMLISSFENQGHEAPLVPLVTVPFHLLFGPGIDQSLIVIPMFFALLVLATFGVARQICGESWAVLSALCVACIPAVIDYSRLYHFAVPAAALLMAALW